MLAILLCCPEKCSHAAELAFMRIGFGMRQALKRKNVPLGILRAIEEQLNVTFTEVRLI
jgi:hypothetical protein